MRSGPRPAGVDGKGAIVFEDKSAREHWTVNGADCARSDRAQGNAARFRDPHLTNACNSFPADLRNSAGRKLVREASVE
jgi:hypothetical protein